MSFANIFYQKQTNFRTGSGSCFDMKHGSPMFRMFRKPVSVLAEKSISPQFLSRLFYFIISVFVASILGHHLKICDIGMTLYHLSFYVIGMGSPQILCHLY